jgi:hypothetical protein
VPFAAAAAPCWEKAGEMLTRVSVLLLTLTNTSCPWGLSCTGMLVESWRSRCSWASAPCWPGLDRLMALESFGSDLLFRVSVQDSPPTKEDGECGD